MISKTITNRLRKVINVSVGRLQNAFVPGRLIAENILVAHELLDNIRKTKKVKCSKISIKADMSKAYDKVK